MNMGENCSAPTEPSMMMSITVGNRKTSYRCLLDDWEERFSGIRAIINI